jgi:hypothetical protein
MSKTKHNTNTTKLKSNKRLLKWLDSFEKVSAAVDKYDLLQLLEEGGGICRIEDFLPTFVAEGIFETLEQLSEAVWNVGCCTIALTSLVLRMTVSAQFAQLLLRLMLLSPHPYLLESLPHTTSYHSWLV